ncbi:MAG: DUF4474 domain-containing protein [Oscillospiraceae bacterium]|jgi:hypothetical protein|nr:DUF4474 domain-containing protein [Oscillospiraceae bacterium]
MLIKNTHLTRLLAALLSLVMLASAAAVSVVPAGAVEPPKEPSPAYALPAENESYAALNRMWDLFWSGFVFLSYMYSPREGYFYTETEPFQRYFGFNKLYDDFAFVANCYIDTIRCKFTYGGKDWLVQLWKGAYGIVLFTGGEMGIYSKPTGRALEHYDSVKRNDWIGMEMAIYRKDKLLFARSMESAWWLTGFGWGTCPNFLSRPRKDCVMEAKLNFQNEEMARLYAAELAEKGFVRSDSISLATPDSYKRSGTQVHVMWKYITESSY